MSAGPHASLVSSLMASTDRPTVRDWVEVLSRLPLFEKVSRRHLRQIASLAQVRDYDRGEFVVQKGAAPDGFYLILAGHAKVVGKPGPALGPGHYFGEIALLDNEPRTATVVAAGELQTMRIPRPAFMRLLKQEPSITLALLGVMAERVRRLEQPPV